MPNCCAIDDILCFLNVFFKFLVKIVVYFEFSAISPDRNESIAKRNTNFSSQKRATIEAPFLV
jgi:hypothetical protein